MADWLLCIDESGDFQSGGVVTGLLLPRSARARDDLTRGLTAQRRGVFALVDHPPHQCVLNCPASWLGRWLLADPATVASVHPPHREVFQALHDSLNRSDHPAPVAFLESIRVQRQEWRQGRRRVDLDTARRLDKWLRTAHPIEHAHLRHLVSRWRDQMRHVLRISLRLGVGACVAAYAHPSRPDYLTTLRHLFERVASLLQAHGGEHTVTLHIAERGKDDSPDHSPIEADTLLLQWPAGSGVAVDEVMTHRYDVRVPAGIVLADLAANRALCLPWRHQTWEQFDVWWMHAVTTPTRWTPDHLPVIAAVDAPDHSTGPDAEAWWVTQAREWSRRAGGAS